jgi:phytoene dehydrogenase-like protein
MIKPECQVGMAFADGRPPLLIYLPELEEKTHASIARYSKHDADRFNEMRRKVMAKDQHLASVMYTPRDLDATRGELLKLWTDLGFELGDMQKTVKELIDESFESTELRGTLYRQALEWGIDPHKGNGVSFVYSVIWLCGMHYMSVGGTHMLGHAMASAALSEGVDLRYNHRVRRILMRGDRASGIELADGRQIEAKIVVSNLDVRTTCRDLLGLDHRRSPRCASSSTTGASVPSTAWARRRSRFTSPPTTSRRGTIPTSTGASTPSSATRTRSRCPSTSSTRWRGGPRSCPPPASG